MTKKAELLRCREIIESYDGVVVERYMSGYMDEEKVRRLRTKKREWLAMCDRQIGGAR